MSVIYILIACSLLLACGFLGAFLWASRSGQFDDDYTPSIRMLFDDGLAPTDVVGKEIKHTEKSTKMLNKKLN